MALWLIVRDSGNGNFQQDIMYDAFRSREEGRRTLKDARLLQPKVKRYLVKSGESYSIGTFTA